MEARDMDGIAREQHLLEPGGLFANWINLSVEECELFKKSFKEFSDIGFASFSTQINELVLLISSTLTEEKIHIAVLVSDLLVIMKEKINGTCLSCSCDKKLVFNTIRAIFQIASQFQYKDVIIILSNFLKVTEECHLDELLDAYLDGLSPGLSLLLISNVIHTSRQSCFTSLLTDKKAFWDQLTECLNSSDATIRKRSLFVLNFMIEACGELQRAINEELTEIVIVLETLEETQSHIIKPILSKLQKFSDSVIERKLDIKWLMIIFHRILEQESRMVSRWGMQLVLQLSPMTFHNDNGVKLLEKLLHMHLNSTYMYYRPCFVTKGQLPPVAILLSDFLQQICTYFDHHFSQQILQNLYQLLGQTKVGSAPLTYITFILSNLQLPYKLSSSFLSNFNRICYVALPTQPNKVKGTVQGFLLKFVHQNIDHNDTESLKHLESFFDCMILDNVMDVQHKIWEAVSCFIKMVSFSHPELLESYATKQLDKHKREFVVAKGFGLILGLSDYQNLLSENIVERLLYPLSNCRTNTYTSESVVICSSSVIRTVFQLFRKENEQSSILTACLRNGDSILDNCSWFLDKYCRSKDTGESSCQREDHLRIISDFLISIVYYNDNLRCEIMFNHFMREDHIIQISSEVSVMIKACANLFQSLLNFDHKPQTLRHFFQEMKSLDWLAPFLESSKHSLLNDAWICFCYLSQHMKVPTFIPLSNLFTLAIETIQKLKYPDSILIVFDLIDHMRSSVLTEDPALFNEAISSMLTILLDFQNSGIYWKLLSKICSIIFHPEVMDHVGCCDSLVNVINDFKDLTSSKEGVMSHITHSLTLYGDSDMKNAEFYLATFLELSVFGVTRTREKQNIDDLIAFIDTLEPCDLLYFSSAEISADVSLVRVHMINLLYSILEKFPQYSSAVVSFYINSITEIQKAALMNSLPNRMRVRCSQALLCLLPVILKHMQPSSTSELLEQTITLLTFDSQPSVRCFVETCVCVILSHHADLITTVMEKISGKCSNAFLTAIFSIIVHHITYLCLRGKLDRPLLDSVMQCLSLWTSANNHNVRSFACACLVQIAGVYPKLGWDIAPHYKLQVEFIASSRDYAKVLSNTTQKNAYFSKFNINHDLCLLNIFESIPRQYHMLDNEIVNTQDLLNLKLYMSYPVVSGEFHLIPTPPSLEQSDYLIKFGDLDDASVLQKKITPWQVMATNLGIDFDRKSTPKGELVVFASLIDKGNNLGGLARTAEIFGVKTVTLNNLEILNNRDFKSLSMTAEKWLNFDEVLYTTDVAIAYFERMKEAGYTIVGVEQSSNSVSLDQFEFPEKSLLVLGRERDGVPVQLLNHLDVCVEIPQLGLVRSLNVHVSASIIIWEYSKQHLFNQKSGMKSRDESGSSSFE